MTEETGKQDFPRSKNIGTLQLPISAVESGVFGKVLSHINFTPIRVECIHFAGYYEMLGISPLFPELESGSMAPVHILKVNTDNDNNVTSVELAE